MDGVSSQRNFPVDEEENKRIYAESQMQRSLERDIRSAKREELTLKAAGIDSSAAHQRVKETQADMRKFVNETGRTRERTRELI